jgi:hypothetical protein
MPKPSGMKMAAFPLFFTFILEIVVIIKIHIFELRLIIQIVGFCSPLTRKRNIMEVSCESRGPFPGKLFKVYSFLPITTLYDWWGRERRNGK